MVELERLDPQSRAIWQMLLEISAKQPTGWTLIGAQMVALHGFERGRLRPRSSVDADVVVDVRAFQGGTRQLSQALMDLGFELASVSPDGVGHRFARGMVSARETDRLIYQDLLAYAGHTGDSALASTLRSYGEPPYEDLFRNAFLMGYYEVLAPYDPPAEYVERMPR